MNQKSFNFLMFSMPVEALVSFEMNGSEEYPFLMAESISVSISSVVLVLGLWDELKRDATV